MMEEARADLYRALRHALSHDRPGGSHHDHNINHLAREIERFIEAKLDDEMRTKAVIEMGRRR